MVLESLKPQQIKLNLLYIGAPATDGIVTFQVPDSGNRHSLIIASSGVITARWPGTVLTAQFYVPSISGMRAYTYDDFGDLIRTGPFLTFTGVATNVVVWETYIENIGVN